MAEDVKAKLVAADETIDLLQRVADEAREHGIAAKLESAEQAIEGETQRKAAINPSAEQLDSTFFEVLPVAPIDRRDEARSEPDHGEDRRAPTGADPASASVPLEAVIAIYSGAYEGSEFTLSSSRTIVGRDPDVDVRLDSESVSRRHAAIIESGGRYYLRDLQSKNGTYLHGVLQSAEQPLADGDRFRIGSSDFVFRLRERK
jgi:hypothetical protein